MLHCTHLYFTERVFRSFVISRVYFSGFVILICICVCVCFYTYLYGCVCSSFVYHFRFGDDKSTIRQKVLIEKLDFVNNLNKIVNESTVWTNNIKTHVSGMSIDLKAKVTKVKKKKWTMCIACTVYSIFKLELCQDLFNRIRSVANKNEYVEGWMFRI